MYKPEVYQYILQQGFKQGKQEGELAVILRQLTRRLGSIDPAVQECLEGLPIAQLEDLAEALLDFTSTRDLENWLRDYCE